MNLHHRISMSIVVFSALAACSSGGSSPTPPSATPAPSPTSSPSPAHSPAPQFLSAPLSLPSPGGNSGPRLAVALAGGAATSILLDTGSTGLRLLPSAMSLQPASSYHDTGTATQYAYGSGTVYYGTVGTAYAGVTFGGNLTFTTPFAFEIVTKVCANVPTPVPTGVPSNCQDTTMAAEKETGGGIVGVRPTANTHVQSPLAEIQAPYNAGFVISLPSSTLTVGTTAANQTGFETVPTGTSTAPDGSPVWANNAVFPWCYAITEPNSSSTVSSCPVSGQVLSDTGGLNENIRLDTAPPAGIMPNVESTLPPSSTVVATITQSGMTSPSITWSLTIGTCRPENAPDFYFDEPSASPSPAASPPSSTNGVTPFFTNDVLYDLQSGYLGFRAEPPVAYAYCNP